MAVHLSEQLRIRIAEKVASGDYPDAETVVDQALSLLDEREQLQELRALIAVGAEQAARGEVVPYDDDFRESAIRRARERFAAGEVAGPDVRP